jgi:hypothetical protein
MIKKKAKAQKAAAKKPAKKRTVRAKKQSDPAQVREQLAGIVKSKAKGITKELVDHAMHGELAPAKYLLEMAGVYPATSDDGQTTEAEDCLAKTLLDRLNLPHKPARDEQEDEPENGQLDTDEPAEDPAKSGESSPHGDGDETQNEGESIAG